MPYSHLPWALRVCRDQGRLSWIFRARFALRHVVQGASLERWYAHLRGQASLASLPLLPMLLLQAQRPFYDYRSSTSERVRSLLDSHTLQRELLTPPLYSALLAGEPCTLCAFQGRGGEEFRLALSCEAGFFREGNITLSLWRGNDRYKVLTFAFDRVDGKVVCKVGGLQAMTRHALEKFRDATRDCHGLQPRVLVVEVLRRLCALWRVEAIEAIATRNHSWNSLTYRLFKRAKGRHLRYDESWMLVGGAVNAQGNYAIPLLQAARPIEDYPSSKRAEVRRRRALLEQVLASVSLPARP